MPIEDVNQSREQLIGQVVDSMTEFIHSGSHPVSPEWFTLDLSMPQVRVVFLLLQETSLRMSDLASTLDVSMSRATGLVDRLVEKGLVDRLPDPEDRRSVLCNLTTQGRDLGRRLLAARRSRWEERLAPLSEAELKKVLRALELALEAIHRGSSEAELAILGTLR